MNGRVSNGETLPVNVAELHHNLTTGFNSLAQRLGTNIDGVQFLVHGSGISELFIASYVPESDGSAEDDDESDIQFEVRTEKEVIDGVAPEPATVYRQQALVVEEMDSGLISATWSDFLHGDIEGDEDPDYIVEPSERDNIAFALNQVVELVDGNNYYPKVIELLEKTAVVLPTITADMITPRTIY